MRRRAAAKVQTNFIDIAPSPPFRRIVAFDDRMAGLAKMLGGVTVWRAVAAADMARTSGRGADAPTPNQVSDIPRIRARSALRYGWFWHAHIRRALSSRDLNSRRGGTTAPGQIGMKRRRRRRA